MGYSSKKLELLALRWAFVEKFRDYLEGGTFVVYTDNNPLTYIMKKNRLPALEQRWANELASLILPSNIDPESITAMQMLYHGRKIAHGKLN